jgi:hypothetical protein
MGAASTPVVSKLKDKFPREFWKADHTHAPKAKRGSAQMTTWFVSSFLLSVGRFSIISVRDS